jgi:curved DNA-binding protein
MERREEPDLYEVLQVSPHAHPVIITKAFRLLAALHHPDNKQTGDEEMFKRIAQAYRILSDPVRRAAYDRERFGAVERKHRSGSTPEDRPLPSENRGDSPEESELRLLLLQALYDVRRGRPYKPALSLMVLSELFGCGIESLQYTLWYLRGKRFIETTDDSEVAITVNGVDHLEASRLGARGSRASQQPDPPIALPFSDHVAAEWPLTPMCHGHGNGSGH